MLEMTDTAVGAIQRAVGRSQGEAKGVRLALVAGSCAELKFKLDLEADAKPGDEIFDYDAYSAEVGRRFQLKSASCSNRSRPGIPVKSAGVVSSAG